jgi:hypothetical protein
MDKRQINLNNLECFLSKAKNKLNEGIEDIGEKNMHLLEAFFSDVKKEKENLLNNNFDINNSTKDQKNNSNYNKEIDFNKSSSYVYEIEYKRDLFNQMNIMVDNSDVPFDVDIDLKNKSADIDED